MLWCTEVNAVARRNIPIYQDTQVDLQLGQCLFAAFWFEKNCHSCRGLPFLCRSSCVCNPTVLTLLFPCPGFFFRPYCNSPTQFVASVLVPETLKQICYACIRVLIAIAALGCTNLGKTFASAAVFSVNPKTISKQCKKLYRALVPGKRICPGLGTSVGARNFLATMLVYRKGLLTQPASLYL